MKKLIIYFCLIMLLCSMVVPTIVSAASIEIETPCSLTLNYAKESVGFQDLEIRIFRVADYLSNGSYNLTGEFAEYPVNIHGITSQKEWTDTACTLEVYIRADKVESTAVANTDSDGTVMFENLQTGLYLVAGADVKTQTEKFSFEPFFIFLPTPDNDGGYNYDLVANPKVGKVTPISSYTLMKLWKDTGSTASRPADVTVEIFKDDSIWDTVELNKSNNWSYKWETEDTEASWSVLEKDVPQGYTVKITEKGNNFTIINTKEGTTPSAPKTGDTTPLWRYVMLMGISGLALIITGILHKRKRS